MDNQGERVLVVDDDPEMGRWLSEVLQGEGFSVVTLDDSVEASKVLRREDFDLLITDLKMKGLKGLDLLAETQKVAPRTPVIIITAFGTIESAIQAMRMGAYDYITKPFRTDEIVLTVKKALENRRLKKVPVDSLTQAIMFSPDSQQFITSDAEGNLQFWGVSDGKLIEGSGQNFPRGSSLATSSQFLAVGAKDKIYILPKDGEGGIPPIESPGTKALLVFNQDGSLLASADAAGQINIWKYQNGKFDLQTSFVKERAESLAFDPAGTQLAVGIPKYVILMDITSGREIARIPANGVVNGVSFSPDGTYLATISTKALQFWETAKINTIQSNGIISAACSRLYENFSQSQWTTLFSSDQAYKKLCNDLPQPQ